MNISHFFKFFKKIDFEYKYIFFYLYFKVARVYV